jgi:hypothetical protein
MIGSGMPISHKRSPRPISSLRIFALSGQERCIRRLGSGPRFVRIRRLRTARTDELTEIKAALQEIGPKLISTNSVERF